MAEYIEREAILSKLTFENGRRIPEVDVDNFPTTVAIRDVKKLIRELPAADVSPAVHGQWIDDLQKGPVCSACGKAVWFWAHSLKPPHCPLCGAKMQEAR